MKTSLGEKETGECFIARAGGHDSDHYFALQKKEQG